MKPRLGKNDPQRSAWRLSIAAVLAGVLTLFAAWCFWPKRNQPSDLKAPHSAEESGGHGVAEPVSTAVDPLPGIAGLYPDRRVPIRRDLFRYVDHHPEVIVTKPPPIALESMEPSTATAGVPRPFEITVTGERFPQDAQIVFGDAPVDTSRVGETLLRAEIDPGQIASPHTVLVAVRSSGHPGELYSNTLPFVVQPAPEPPFRFVGLIGDLAVFESTGPTSESFRARRGDVIRGNWRIESFGSSGVAVTDLRHGIRRHLFL